MAQRQAQKFGDLLRKTDSAIVLSLHNVTEISAPLVESKKDSAVMKTLSALEHLPHRYIAEVNVQPLELAEAINAFLGKREYRSVDPFVPAFANTVSPFDTAAAAPYEKVGLAQTVFELWQDSPAAFRPYKTEAAKLRVVRDADRRRPDLRHYEKNFANTVRRNLELYKMHTRISANQLGPLADWIWEIPKRCPATRLGYEVFHQISINKTDKGEDSDIADLAHLDCLPYVDALTADNRMRQYISQADRSGKTNYAGATLTDVEDVNALLN